MFQGKDEEPTSDELLDQAECEVLKQVVQAAKLGDIAVGQQWAEVYRILTM